nr:hypothetical protein [Tanacetum cinerariifolium]
GTITITVTGSTSLTTVTIINHLVSLAVASPVVEDKFIIAVEVCLKPSSTARIKDMKFNVESKANFPSKDEISRVFGSFFVQNEISRVFVKSLRLIQKTDQQILKPCNSHRSPHPNEPLVAVRLTWPAEQ